MGGCREIFENQKGAWGKIGLENTVIDDIKLDCQFLACIPMYCL